MNCQVCGSKLIGNEQTCPRCGVPLNSQNSNIPNQNVNVGQNQQVSAQMPISPDQNINSNQVMGNHINQLGIPTNNQVVNNKETVHPQNITDNNQSKKPMKINRKNIVIILVSVLVVIIATICIIKLQTNSLKGNNTTESVEKNKVVTYTIKYNDFSLNIPTELIYKVENNAMVISDKDGYWKALITMKNGSYANLLSNISSLQTIYQQNGYTASEAKEIKNNDMPMITLEISKNDTNILMCFARASTKEIFNVTLYSTNNEYDYDTAKKLLPILSTITYNEEEENNDYKNVNIDLNDLLIKVKEE